MKVVIVTGGRDFTDETVINDALSAQMPFYALVQGTARGADRLCAEWARKRGIQVLDFPADWDGPDGNAAGFVRNGLMMDFGVQLWDAGEEVVVVAFPGNNGTADAMRKARKRGLTLVKAGIHKQKG